MTNDAELIGGVEKRDLTLVPHDPQWFHRFRIEQDRIVNALGASAHRIDHIGSTAVAGLDAKPIVDINISVADPDEEDTYLPRLLEAGYLLRVREPRHRMLRTPDLGVHVHACAAGSDWERRHLLFRDWLRLDRADRDLYAHVKRELVRRDWPDMNAYAAAKSEVIASITQRAEAWALATGWSVSLSRP
ncbi:GrpB family protein [Lolliginicoccus suaedae]|uniref:GrpB family protein n=1 Tax=Lolliginicoccus suaedae TaxID=2605429 RepID=UPI0011EDFFC4|nr:GrpB family protein [Lolliginicoccus suaedae]